jgi:hypothetical protein
VKRPTITGQAQEERNSKRFFICSVGQRLINRMIRRKLIQRRCKAQ